jgi:predicted helicase
MVTLDQLISTLPADSGRKGKAYECLCAWFLLNDPVYASQLRRVWLWDKRPDRWGPNNGIDLVAEAHDGGT